MVIKWYTPTHIDFLESYGTQVKGGKSERGREAYFLNLWNLNKDDDDDRTKSNV